MAKRFLTKLQMQRLARLEDTFDKYISFDSMPHPYDNLDFEDTYEMTLEDIEAVYENLVEQDMFLRDIFYCWYLPLTQLDDHFIVDIDDIDESSNEIRGLSTTEDEMLAEAWNLLDETMQFAQYLLITDNDYNPHVSDSSEMKEMLEAIRLFWENENKPLMEKEFALFQKTAFIQQFSDEDFLDDAEDIEIELCRKITDELCEENNESALELKGYACYGGNRLYECDWKYSRDCMEKLFDLTDEAMYANTLGYIYYYGRCNGGIPEYDKAFPMFVTSAANGIYEGIYKLADMYKNGYGCRKSPKTAFRLYKFVYDDCFDKFIDGHDAKFADAALRLGNAYYQGIGVEKDPVLAYAYYLQADLASDMRIKEDDFFGNTSVALGIKRSLAEVRKELPDDYFEPYYHEVYPSMIENMTEGGNVCRLSVSARKEGNCVLTITRVHDRNKQKSSKLLFCMPAQNYCALSDKIKIKCIDVRISYELYGPRPIFFDSIKWDARGGALNLFINGRRVGFIEAGEYRFYPPRKKKPSGLKTTFASVMFDGSNRTYDYICDLPDVAKGDRVIVNGYDGETEVSVKSLFSIYESELPISLDRYKKVLRKI